MQRKAERGAQGIAVNPGYHTRMRIKEDFSEETMQARRD